MENEFENLQNSVMVWNMMEHYGSVPKSFTSYFLLSLNLAIRLRRQVLGGISLHKRFLHLLVILRRIPTQRQEPSRLGHFEKAQPRPCQLLRLGYEMRKGPSQLNFEVEVFLCHALLQARGENHVLSMSINFPQMNN